MKTSKVNILKARMIGIVLNATSLDIGQWIVEQELPVIIARSWDTTRETVARIGAMDIEICRKVKVSDKVKDSKVKVKGIKVKVGQVRRQDRLKAFL